MNVRKVELRRLSVSSRKPFEAVVAALKAAVGTPNLGEFMKSAHQARSLAELEKVVKPALGKTGLMMFLELDLGAVLRLESGLKTPKIVRFLVGNPLLMKEMAKHVPDAGSYAPVTILAVEEAEGVRLTYDTMASFLEPYGNSRALAMARDLDAKIETLLSEAAA
jgi:uncharacterized protein (DUF302 family)